MSDESLREFQLNGKQLVFLFMASTVVAVVIFLCGVMVGRGVSTAQLAAVPDSMVDMTDPTAGEGPLSVPSSPAAPLSVVPPDAPTEDPQVEYPRMLTAEKPSMDLEKPKPAPKVAPKPAAKPEPKPAAPQTQLARATPPAREAARDVTPAAAPAAAVVAPAAAARTADVEPPGTGFVVQVAATPRRAEADAISARLKQKGYPAFVTTAGRVFRVRVGKYKDRDEAAGVARRLETQERFKPWVTR